MGRKILRMPLSVFATLCILSASAFAIWAANLQVTGNMSTTGGNPPAPIMKTIAFIGVPDVNGEIVATYVNDQPTRSYKFTCDYSHVVSANPTACTYTPGADITDLWVQNNNDQGAAKKCGSDLAVNLEAGATIKYRLATPANACPLGGYVVITGT